MESQSKKKVISTKPQYKPQSVSNKPQSVSNKPQSVSNKPQSKQQSVSAKPQLIKKATESKSNLIPEQDVDYIKRHIDLVELVKEDGVKLKKSGKDFVGLCPFHDDRKPSLVITPAKNLWHCFGCGKAGSVIDWVMERKGVGFRQAVEELRPANLCISSQPLKPKSQPKSKPKPFQIEIVPVVDKYDENQAALQRVIAYYHERLKISPVAIAYLEKRGIAKAIDKFKIGFADRTLSIKLCNGNKQQREQLCKLGILRDSGHEHFNGSIVIPIMDKGKIGEVYGRKINDHLRRGTNLHMYLPGAHVGVFNREGLRHESIVTEAMIDALSFWVNGFQNVTSSYGTGGFTDEMLEALLDAKTKRLFIAYDNDDSGNKAAIKLAAKLANYGIECLRVLFPLGMDANSFICEKKEPHLHLKQLLAQALPINKPALVSKPMPENIPSLAAKNEEKKAAEQKIQAKLYQNIEVEQKGEDIFIRLCDREYRIRGLCRNLAFDVMKVNIRGSARNEYHIDTLDLYQARHRHNFIRTTSVELGIHQDIIKRDVGQILLKLEELQQLNIDETLNPKKVEVVIPEDERKEALQFLHSPGLIEKISQDFVDCGLVGETMNTLIGYLAATSRKLDDPLALIIQSSSSAGKSSLMDMILDMMPEEEKVKYTAMTGQSLFYMGETNLKHKILAICEEEGAEKASYALKTMQSEKRLTIASTGKDPKTGRLATNEYTVEGPTQIMLSTTSEEIDEEFQNRCLIATVDEGRKQTKAIHNLQRERETLNGVFGRRQREQILRKQQNAQRLLKTILVVNPYAKKLTFLDSALRTRRDHMKYLTLIRANTLLHQYQRPQKTVRHEGKDILYIEATREDIVLANSLMHNVLGISLDEMAPQTRKLLNLLYEFVSESCKQYEVEQQQFRFSRKDIRKRTGWSNTQLKVHLDRLVDMEYLLSHRGKRGLCYVYELVYCNEANDTNSFVMGLLNPASL